MSAASTAITSIETARLKLARAKNAMVVKIDGYRLRRDHSQLEKDLARIIETSNHHDARNVAHGDPVHVALKEKAIQKINRFCSQWPQFAFTDIKAEVPALNSLYERAIPKRRMSPGAKLLATLLAGGATLFFAGVASGVVQSGHHVALQVLHFIHLG